MKKLLVLGWVFVAMGSSVSVGAEGLVAYWSFDTDFSNTEGTTDYDGIPTGTAEISAEDVKVGAGALKIDDNASSANHVAAMGDFVGPAPVVRTVVGWYKYKDISGDGSDARNFIWETQPTYSLSFGIRDGAAGKYSQWYYDTQAAAIHGDGPVVADDLWHHAAVIWNSELGHIKYYHDGQLFEAIAIDTDNNPKLDQAGFNIGTHRTADGGRNWDGYLDEIAIFSVELSEEQVLDLYERPEAVNPLNIFALEMASNIQPPTDGSDILRDVVLSWEPGFYGVKHNVYFGTVLDDVDNAETANPLDVLVSAGQEDTCYDVGTLEFGQTYYWRIDEVNGAPDNTVFKGEVWSFTVEPLSYAIEGAVATSNGTPDADGNVENTVNGSGLDDDDLHSVESSDMWLAIAPDDEPLTITFEFDRVYKMHEMLVWNYNVAFELLLGFGLKDVTVEYSSDGTDWATLGDLTLAQATAVDTYQANTTVAFEGVAARYVKLTVNSAYGTRDKFGLSEVRFMQIPAQAREPQPDDGAVDVSVETILAWRSGREAVSHEVRLGTDPEALAVAGVVDAASLDPGMLDLEMTYCWQVNEVNEADEISVWPGSVWTFSTQAFLVIEDFESYNDDDNRIYQSWVDGYDDPSNGSQVGNLESPFAEQTLVKSGEQSMPLFYDNAGASMAEAEFSLVQNWATSGIKSLSIAFAGAAGNTGQLYIKINGTKVLYDGAAGDIALSTWQAWNIDLSTVGNVSNVTSLIIGIEGADAPGVVYIDDVRLYPRDAEKTEPVQPESANRVGWWTFDDGSGSVARDQSGQGNDATQVLGELQWVAGTIDGALEFDGVRHKLALTSPLTVGASSSTIATWIKVPLPGTENLDADERVGTILGNYPDTPNTNWELHSDGQMRLHWNGGEVNIYGTTDLRDNRWHHIAWVRDKATDTCAMYVDGRLEVSHPSAGSDVTFGTVHTIGGDNRASGIPHFHGGLDDLQVYSEALSAAEVAWLAGLRVPIDIPF